MFLIHILFCQSVTCIANRLVDDQAFMQFLERLDFGGVWGVSITVILISNWLFSSPLHGFSYLTPVFLFGVRAGGALDKYQPTPRGVPSASGSNTTPLDSLLDVTHVNTFLHEK